MLHERGDARWRVKRRGSRQSIEEKREKGKKGDLA